ncbi:MAG: calcium/sodium antiporter [Gemmatimonadota bacterium]|nr:calcium/sodium antiporter [Gemmatimonadota bacterium]MDE2781645.1 calcium/sodium antiporter [Gemmatimonadota bacterium]MDE2865314.1 calcium/sodium antiporter [Gemmatimonadota bacterium]MYB05454.1 calcium/sodium antiporter [Gemmatimonadota bacterium]MYE17533.1 calcium/sodium antiporter [Gemmatimonadota bacterium]
MTTLANVLLLLGGFGALYFGAEWLVRGAARIAAAMGTSPVVVGLTLVSLGTSAPELVVGVIATLNDEGGLLVGNVLGSNLANIGLILGGTALIKPLSVADRVISRDVPIMIVITILAFPFVLDLEVDWGDGLILLALLVAYVSFTFWTEDDEIRDIREGVGTYAGDEEDGEQDFLRNLGLVVIGAAGLGVGGKAIVDSATYLSGVLGASPEVIGLTIVAVGTSLPELVTSIVAAARKQADIAVGNIVGSNIFNIAAVMGASALVRGYPVDQSILTLQLPAVLILSVLVWPVVASARRVRRSEGLLLLLVYFGLMGWITLGS